MARCREHDPILWAGFVRCGCGGTSYPVTAEWITDWLILAAYDDVHERPCRQHVGMVLVDVDAEAQAIPRVQRPRLCRAMAATTGQPCRAVARPGSGFCYSHDPARSRSG